MDLNKVELEITIISLLVLFMTGCSVNEQSIQTVSITTELPPTSTSTSTELPPTSTPLPTDTPTITPAEPEPGAIFSGQMEVKTPGSNASASGGSIKFTITEDGTGIANAGYSIMNTNCVSPSGSTTITSGGSESLMTPVEPTPITKGSFEFISGEIIIKGQFTSPTEANGTILLSTKEGFGSPETFICEFGTWSWDATVGVD